MSQLKVSGSHGYSVVSEGASVVVIPCSKSPCYVIIPCCIVLMTEEEHLNQRAEIRVKSHSYKYIVKLPDYHAQSVEILFDYIVHSS